MIYTVTFNPSIDYVIFTNDFKIDGLNRATATYKFTGGKVLMSGASYSKDIRCCQLPWDLQVDFLGNSL